MSTEQAPIVGPIQLSFRSIQQVVVEQADEDRFMMTAKEAARAYALAQNEKELREQFVQVILFLREWCRHNSEVERCYGYPGDGHFNILVCTTGAEYRHDIEDQVTQLDVNLFRQFPWLRAELVHVPSSVADKNVTLEKAIVIYGKGI